jgi:hypothetical protein
MTFLIVLTFISTHLLWLFTFWQDHFIEELQKSRDRHLDGLVSLTERLNKLEKELKK